MMATEFTVTVKLDDPTDGIRSMDVQNAVEKALRNPEAGLLGMNLRVSVDKNAVVSWRKARDLLTGEAGDGEVGANQAQQILEDLAHFPGTVQFYRNEQGSGYLSYAGLDAYRQPRYLDAKRSS